MRARERKRSTPRRFSSSRYSRASSAASLSRASRNLRLWNSFTTSCNAMGPSFTLVSSVTLTTAQSLPGNLIGLEISPASRENRASRKTGSISVFTEARPLSPPRSAVALLSDTSRATSAKLLPPSISARARSAACFDSTMISLNRIARSCSSAATNSSNSSGFVSTSISRA